MTETENHDNLPKSQPAAVEIIRIPKPIRYRDAYRAQTFRRDQVMAGEKTEAIFLLEHLPVVTMGRNSHPENLLCDKAGLARLGIELHEIDRGGDVTYHGPGQAVAYPILDLQARNLTIRQYLRMLEQVVIDVLATYGLSGERVSGFTGVWVGGAKVAAIGVGARRWVTYHGLALNVDPDPTHFATIIPCGIADKPITSLKTLLGTPPPLTEVFDRLEHHLLQTFAQNS